MAKLLQHEWFLVLGLSFTEMLDVWASSDTNKMQALQGGGVAASIQNAQAQILFANFTRNRRSKYDSLKIASESVGQDEPRKSRGRTPCNTKWNNNLLPPNFVVAAYAPSSCEFELESEWNHLFADFWGSPRQKSFDHLFLKGQKVQFLWCFNQGIHEGPKFCLKKNHSPDKREAKQDPPSAAGDRRQGT